jgi:hypothetical protein
MIKKIKGWITISILTPTLFSCNAQHQNMVKSANKATAKFCSEKLPDELRKEIYNEWLHKRNSVNLQLAHSRSNRDFFSKFYKIGYIEIENDKATSHNETLEKLKE